MIGRHCEEIFDSEDSSGVPDKSRAAAKDEIRAPVLRDTAGRK
jgi:hypothetical protein